MAKKADRMNLLRQVTAEIDRMFNQEYRWPGLANRGPGKAATWYPEIDVFEEDDSLVAKIDLPGLKKEDVKVEVADGQLTIAGERKTETDEKKHNFYRCERAYGSFYRVIPLPDGIEIDTVKAIFTDGVLEVRVPLSRHAAARPKAVTIEDSGSAAKPAA